MDIPATAAQSPFAAPSVDSLTASTHSLADSDPAQDDLFCIKTSLDAAAGVPAAGQLLSAFFWTVVGDILTTAICMPFAVGTTLAQVQWNPRFTSADLLDEKSDEFIEIDNDSEVDTGSSSRQSQPTASESLISPSRRSSSRTGVDDEEACGPKADWIMPVVSGGGVFEMMRSLVKFQGEGWTSLWKGQLTTCIREIVYHTVQPLLFTTLTAVVWSSAYYDLSDLLLVYSPRAVPLLLCSVLSHVVTTIFLSPLDLIRTRLIVQSAQPQHRKYNGLLHAIKTILEVEGGLCTTYCHPHLLIPAILEGIQLPLAYYSAPIIVSRLFRIEPLSTPVAFALAEFFLRTSSLLITIPLDTIRKRLHLQIRADGGIGRAFKTCVEVRPRAYDGVVDAVYRIITEEAGHTLLHQQRVGRGVQGVKEDAERVGPGVFGGVSQLYRGYGLFR